MAATDIDGTVYRRKDDLGDWLFEYLISSGKLPSSEQARTAVSMWEAFNGFDPKMKPDPRTMYAWHVKAMGGLRAAEVQETVESRFRDIRLFEPVLAALREVVEKGDSIVAVTANNAFAAEATRAELRRRGIPVAHVRSTPVPVDQRGLITCAVERADCPYSNGKVVALEAIVRKERRATGVEPLFLAGFGDSAGDLQMLQWIEQRSRRGWSLLVNASDDLLRWAARRPSRRHAVSLGEQALVRTGGRPCQIRSIRHN